MKKVRITPKQAEAALAVVIERFKPYLEPMTLPADESGPEMVLGPMCSEPPKLVPAWDGGHYAIVWEDGPSDWAFTATAGGISEEEASLLAEAKAEFGADFTTVGKPPVVWPKGVHAEPYFSFVLSLYPA